MSYKLSSKFADLRMPHEWWEKTRNLTRNFVFHHGPTNSGKTYNALEYLKRSNNGVYCGPLRLLATEIYEKLTLEGIKCTLKTGQEQIITPGATHISCTTESLKLSQIYDTAVIDEIQMISDDQRGSAWTNAVLGLNASNIHVTGDYRAREILKKIIEKTEDNYSEIAYKRLSKLYLSPPLISLKNLRPKDCFVVFSRKKCHALKNIIEKIYPNSCAIIYGNLPPEVRKDQAQRFNSQQYKFLVSTDAIGMGLNYNIDRIVFMETSKNDGRKVRKLTPYEIRQIAGRAGRSQNDGEVTAYDARSFGELSSMFKYNREDLIQKAGIFPMYEQIKEFVDNYHYPEEINTYPKILNKFSKLAILENIYFLENINSKCELAYFLKDVNLNIEDMHRICNSSLRKTGQKSGNALKEMAERIRDKNKVRFDWFDDKLAQKNLIELEELYVICVNYLILSVKFIDTYFEDINQVRVFINLVSSAILDKLNLVTDFDLISET